MATVESERGVVFCYNVGSFVGVEGIGAAVRLVLSEIDRQVGKWGVQSHSQANWYAILGEEFGEVGRAICEVALAGRGDSVLAELRVELIHTAAVAIAMAESLERCGFGGAA